MHDKLTALNIIEDFVFTIFTKRKAICTSCNGLTCRESLHLISQYSIATYQRVQNLQQKLSHIGLAYKYVI